MPSVCRILKNPSPRMATSKFLARRQQRALRHDARRADDFHAAAEIDADRQDVALGRCLGADAADVLVEQVLEFRTLLLVAGLCVCSRCCWK